MTNSVVPMNKRVLRKAISIHRILSSSIRLIPNFILFGVQRSGTTSLYNYLIQHPYIVSSITKEIGFFEANYFRGINWYKSHFPTTCHKYFLKQKRKHEIITGEATPSYINHPKAPERIFSMIPNIKLILLLRNPVDRAYSHYFQSVKLGRENLSFEKAIDIEAERLQGEEKKMLTNEDYYSLAYHNFAYLSSGIYIKQLKNWKNIFSEEQLTIIKSEDLFSNPSSVLKQTFDFLNLPDWKLKKYERYNYNPNQPQMDNSIRKRLVEFFKPHNKKLYEFLGRNFSWDR